MDVRDGTDEDRSHLEKSLKELGFHVIAFNNIYLPNMMSDFQFILQTTFEGSCPEAEDL